MTVTPIVLSSPLECDWSAKALIAAGFSPLVAGDDWELRLQVLNESSSAVSLDGALIVMTLATLAPTTAETVERRFKPSTLFSRRSDTNISGSSPPRLQIDIDDDQTVETGNTGKGWFSVRFGREEADRAALIAAVGLRAFDIRVRFGDSSIKTFARGRIEILRPRLESFA